MKEKITYNFFEMVIFGAIRLVAWGDIRNDD